MYLEKNDKNIDFLKYKKKVNDAINYKYKAKMMCISLVNVLFVMIFLRN
jgi:hypothetical protein